MSQKLHYVYPPLTMEEYYTRYPEGHTIFESYIEVVNEVNKTIDVVNDSIEHFNTELSTTVDASVILRTQELIHRLNNLLITPVPTGEVIAQEIIDARQGALSLGANITAVKDESVEIAKKLSRAEKIQLQGTSFVDELLSMMTIRSMYVKNNATSDGIDVGVNLEDSLDSVIEYNFKYNPDNLLLLRGVKTGNILASRTFLTPTLQGTFINSTTHYHTVTIGDKFSFKFTGTELEFRLPTEARGGLWEFKLSNGQSKRISCYDPSAVLVGKQVNVFKGLDYNTYFGEATFLGDDPDNPPSSSPSRGYLYNPSSSWTLRQENKNGYIDTATARDLISPNTIPDFAISARANGETYPIVWVPYHTVANVSLNPAIKVVIDGVDMITIPGGLLVADYNNIKSFEIIQTFDARNPNDPGDPLWKHYVYHTIKKENPCCVIQNRMEMLRNTFIASAYLTMNGVNSTQVSRLVLNNGVEYNSIPNDGSELQFDYDVSSALYVGEYSAGRTHGTAIDVKSYADAVGLRKRPPTDNTLPGLLTFRTDNVAKIYLRALPNNSVLLAGDVLRNTQRLACITGIKFPNTLLKTL